MHMYDNILDGEPLEQEQINWDWPDKGGIVNN